MLKAMELYLKNNPRAPKEEVNKRIENYNIYFVCPARSTAKEAMAADHDWIEEAISAPSFDRIVYANNSALLYGDYKISTSDDTDFMGTNIRLGSDEFKTWDEIITYFERLGGQ